MCLQGITKKYDTPSMKVRRAYKIVDHKGASPFRGAVLAVGGWRKAYYYSIIRTEPIYGTHGSPGYYEAGFHTFATRKEARTALRFLKFRSSVRHAWKVVLVEVRQVTSEGYDGTSEDPSFLKLKLRNLVSRWIRVVSLEAQ